MGGGNRSFLHTGQPAEQDGSAGRGSGFKQHNLDLYGERA